MMSTKDFSNKIKWSDEFDRDNITLYYEDRIENRLKLINLKEIRIEGNFLIDEESEIPRHRIREAKERGRLIWRKQIMKN